MRKSILISFLLAISACANLPAQTFSLITGREPITSLDGLWRFHTGDNPAWASPTFDDSEWPLLRSDESWTKQGYPDYGGYAWYRFTIQVPDGSKPLALLLPTIYTGYQVYAGGKLIESAGSTAPSLAPIFARDPRVFPLPPGNPGPSPVHVAIRVWEYQPIASWVGGGTLTAGSAAGDPALLAHRRETMLAQQNQALENIYAYGLLAAVVGITILGLFLLRRTEREYLWFSILLLVGAVHAALDIAGWNSVRFLLFRLADEVLAAVGMLAAMAFFVAVLKARRSIWWRMAFAAASLSPISVALYYLQWGPVGFSYALQLFLLLPAYVWIITALSIASAKGNVAARLLLAPAALLYGYNTFVSVVSISWELGWQRWTRSPDVAILQHPFPLRASELISNLFVLALLMFLVRRFSLARQEEERLAGEFEAAKSVQSLLIPIAPPATPGFAVESVYLPAQEVGGDFFQVLPGDDGSLLIIVGDVSGKGLQAAMTVSAIVGALRDSPERRPAQVLAHLNRVLCGQIGGFVTCSATLITEDGAITIASAGHLPPYRNGEELPVPSGLPLGMLAEASYEETKFELAPADRLTFVSDGVVEARDAKGELLGFERMATLTSKSATEIAEAAQRWGQQDDITVVAVTRVAKEKSTAAGLATLISVPSAPMP
ncbi:MAG TPA: SpoIIE family protein phosphatase [Terracidiphilus sp.]|nr:SpoIIE family protein phosphatase [Terracidiphilus sp.]